MPSLNVTISQCALSLCILVLLASSGGLTLDPIRSAAQPRHSWGLLPGCRLSGYLNRTRSESLSMGVQSTGHSRDKHQRFGVRCCDTAN
jgi:hypothetical protein